MSNTLNYFFLSQIASSSSSNRSGLTDLELIKENPAIAVIGAIFILIGLICNFYLILNVFTGDRSPGGFRFQFSKVPPWNVDYLELAKMFALVVLILLSGSLLAAVMGGHGSGDESKVTEIVLWVEILLRVGLFVWLLQWVRRKGTTWRRMIRVADIQTLIRTLGKGIFGFFSVLPPLMFVMILYSVAAETFNWEQSSQPIIEWFVNANSPYYRVLLASLAVVIAPIFEEVLFRGIGYPILKHYLGMRRAILVVSIFFALIHFHVGSMLPLFVLAIAFNLAYEHTGSLLTPILMHSMFNGMNVAALAVRSWL